MNAHGPEVPEWTDAARSGVPAHLRRVHLIGIGGAGMSGIARILLARGAEVSGSDARDSRTLLALQAIGARTAVGHARENLDLLGADPTVIVTTKAVHQTDPNNPELLGAADRGIPIVHRSEVLASLMQGHRVVAVTGTAGKTSTTSMLTVALQHTGADPSFLIGGDLSVSGAGAHAGHGDVFVAEADESDGSFLVYSPNVAVVTNIEADHLDHHGSVEAYAAVFDEFLARIVPGGLLVANGDDPGTVELARKAVQAGVRVRTFGNTADADALIGPYRPDGGAGEADVTVDGATHRLRVAVPGEHMIANATAALLAGLELGAQVRGLLEGLAGFSGVRRRFEYIGRVEGVRVYDDYAHHPTKVAAALRGARQVVGPPGTGRLLVAFQPHLYSRTRDFAEAFGRALGLADVVLVLDVYGAREDPQPGISGALVAGFVPQPGPHVEFVPSFSAVAPRMAELARSGDVVVTMGAGDVTMLAPEIVLELQRRSGGRGTREQR